MPPPNPPPKNIVAALNSERLKCTCGKVGRFLFAFMIMLPDGLKILRYLYLRITAN